jgi:cellulose synthase/poly-beta-1,6-N-acetylglucosamine synthase-like glycosyltransferase
VDRIVTDDLLIPLRVAEAGYHVKYEPRALSFERVSGSVAGEFRRKVRIGASNFSTLQVCRSLLNPRRGFVAYALWSHKVLRWVNPLFFLLILGSSGILALSPGFFRAVAAGEILFFVLVLAGWYIERRRLKAGLLGLPYYFVVANAALCAGLFRFLRGGQRTTWEVVR